MIKKQFLKFILLALLSINSKIYAQSAYKNENEWLSKHYSLSLGPGISMLPYFGSIAFEVLNFNYRPTEHFQLTITNGFEVRLYVSLLAGYTYSWDRWRWFAEGGCRVDWRPSFLIGPAISTGIEYLLLNWLALGLKINASYMLDVYGQGILTDGGGRFFLHHPETALLLTVNFVF